MNYYIDTEFIEGTQKKHFLGFTIGNTKPTVDLISIGIVAENGREYYAISKEFNLKEAWDRVQITTHPDEKPSYWIRENVLKPIFNELLITLRNRNNRTNGEMDTNDLFDIDNMAYLLDVFGKTKKQIAQEVQKFVATTHCNCDRNEEDVNICKRHTPISFYGYYSAYDWVAFCQLFGIMMNLPKGFPYYCRDLKQIADNIWETTGKDTRFNTGKEEHNSLLDARWNKEFHKFLLNIK